MLQGILSSKRYTQVEGLDYKETFAPLAELHYQMSSLGRNCSRMVPIPNGCAKCFFAWRLKKKKFICYVYQGRVNRGNTLCRPQKSLYGLKQASRNWYARFFKAICKVDFVQSLAGYSLFTKYVNKYFTIVYIYR